MSYNQNTRIKLEMSGLEVLMAMSRHDDGGFNPGALRVCKDLLAMGADIDPDNAMGGFGPLLALDSLGVYADRVWMLYKDVCGQDYAKMIAVLRSVQFGSTPFEVLNHAIDNRGAGFDLAAAVAAVKERLPAFQVAV